MENEGREERRRENGVKEGVKNTVKKDVKKGVGMRVIVGEGAIPVRYFVEGHPVSSAWLRFVSSRLRAPSRMKSTSCSATESSD